MNGEVDESRKLKSGEVKTLLQTENARVCSTFSFLHYRNTFYSFQRLWPLGPYHVIELVHIGVSLKGGFISCNVASTINPCRINRHNYGTGLITGYWGLTNLKAGSSILTVEKSNYHHNSRVATTTAVIKDIFDDIRKFALPRLATHRRKIETSEIVVNGLSYVDRMTIDASLLRQEVEGDLKKSGGFYSSIVSSEYLDLKRFLQSIPGQTREDRKLIPRTAYELLELYWCTKQS